MFLHKMYVLGGYFSGTAAVPAQFWGRLPSPRDRRRPLLARRRPAAWRAALLLASATPGLVREQIILPTGGTFEFSPGADSYAH